jgi:hypothetical protein
MNDIIVTVRLTLSTVKKTILMMAVVILAFQLPTPAFTTLTITPLGNGFYQIVAPGSVAPGLLPPACVLQSSTDLIAWTSMSTNIFPTTGAGYGVTNIVQATNSMMFYRVINPGPIPVFP